MKVLDLFSGIGGFSLGLEKAGMMTIAFCESNIFCKGILRKHWKNIPIYDDVMDLCRWTWKKSKGQKLLRQAFLARTYHTREKVPEYPAQGLACGGKLGVAFAWYDHSTSCWRTWQRCWIEGWEQYSEVWPKSGMTRNGIAYRLPVSELTTRERERSFLPTITASESRGSARNRYKSSSSFRGARMSEGLRICQTDATYTNPNFAEAQMGYARDWTRSEIV